MINWLVGIYITNLKEIIKYKDMIKKKNGAGW